MNMVDTGSTIGLLRLPHLLTIVVGGVVVARETMVDSRHYRSWSINSVRLSGYYQLVVLVGTVSNVVSSLIVMKASFAIIRDLTNVVLLSLVISLILRGCIGLI